MGWFRFSRKPHEQGGFIVLGDTLKPKRLRV